LSIDPVEDPHEHALLHGVLDIAHAAGAHVICSSSGALCSYHGVKAQRNVLYDIVTAENVDARSSAAR
jgi:hypothetical protein